MADIYISYGSNMREMAYQLMDRSNIWDELSGNMKVLIKPNMVLPSPPSNGATTHSEVVEGIIQYLKEYKIDDITIGESSWVGEKDTYETYRVCGFMELKDKYNIKLYDMKDDAPLPKSFQGRNYDICQSVEDYDYIINVPVLKGHCQTKVTCCMKNLKGLIPDKEKRRYHTLGLHQPIADLNGIIKPNLHIIDSICGDLTYEEGGNPVDSKRLILGKDPVLLDTYCAKLLGYEPTEIEYLTLAESYGIGNFPDETTIVDEPDADSRPPFPKDNGGLVKKLSKFINENSSCSACYSALIFALHKLDFSKLSDVGLSEKIKIGQGFKGKKEDGLGVGNCTSGCEHYVKGCPPSAVDIIQKIEGI